MDADSCGEYSHLSAALQGEGAENLDRANLVPSGATLEYWKSGSYWRGTSRLCEGSTCSTYSVSQENLPKLATGLQSWNYTGLFAVNPVDASNLHRAYTQGLPGQDVWLETHALELDPSAISLKETAAVRHVAAPAAGKCKTVTLGSYYDTFWGPRESMSISGVLCTSSAPAS